MDVFVKDSNIPEHMCDHNYVECKESGLTIDQQFADDVGWVSTSTNKTKQIEIETEQKLNKRNLKLNKTKTEKYKISGMMIIAGRNANILEPCWALKRI